MSGGSLNYLYSKEPGELFEHTIDLLKAENMLINKGYSDIAKDVANLATFIDLSKKHIEFVQQELRDTLKALEWCIDGDYDDDKLEEAVERYRERKQYNKGGKTNLSAQYDLYLQKHKANVQKGFDWIRENLPELLLNAENIEWQAVFSHDASKSEPDEYDAYDAYFYGGNRSYEVVQNFRKAWLLHIHRNPHHWQYWILINDDPNEGEIILDMPYNYILEMICDWWAFSWQQGNLSEIFNWYDEHKDYIKLSNTTRKTVEDILGKIKEKLSETDSDSEELMHHGVKGQKWGVQNGPPYPLKSDGNSSNIVTEAIKSGEGELK